MNIGGRAILRAVAKLLVDAMNYGELTNEEDVRVHAAYRRVIIALTVEEKLSKIRKG